MSANVEMRPEFGYGASADFVIVGGGPAGIYLADEMQKRMGAQAHGILVEQKTELGGDSGASLQQFRTFQGDYPLLSLVGQTVEWYKEQEGGQLVDSFPYLFIASNQGQLMEKLANLENVRRHGFGHDAEELSGDELRKRYPFIDHEVTGAILYPDAGSLDFNRIMAETVSKASNMKFALGTRFGEVKVEGGRVISVITDRGEIKTNKVVLCPGPFVLNAVNGGFGARIMTNGEISNIVSVQKRQSFTSAVSGLPPHTRVFVIEPDGAYVSLRVDGTGAGEGTYGYADPNDPILNKNQVIPNPSKDWDFPAVVYDHLSNVMSAYGEDTNNSLAVTPISQRAGHYVDTIDDHPIISATPIQGLYINTAYSHMGIMAGHGGAKVMADIIDEKANELAPFFALDRQYGDGSGIKL